MKVGTREWRPLWQMDHGQSSEPTACVACTSASTLGCPWTWLFVANSLPLQLAGSSWKRELLGNKSKQPSLPPGPRDWRGCASSCTQTACRVGGGSRGGNHWAELGVARVTGVLAARGQLRSEKEENPSALPLLISQLCNSGCEAARIAL